MICSSLHTFRQLHLVKNVLHAKHQSKFLNLFLQNLLFQLPLTTYLASYLGQKISGTSSFSNGTSKSRPAVKDEHKWGFCWFVFMTGILFLTFLLQLYGSVSFWQAYGFMAFVFSPVKTWSLVLLIFLVRKTMKIVK